MKKTIQNKIVEYGTNELKKHIRTSTRNAFLITNGIFIVLIISILSYSCDNIKNYFPPFRVISEVVNIPIVPPIKKTDNVPNTVEAPPTPISNEIGKGGSIEKFGNLLGIEDNLITDTTDIADITKISFSTSQGGGTGYDPNQGLSPEPVQNYGNGNNLSSKVLPDEDVFTPVEKLPEVDINRLQRLVSYPEMARRLGVEGNVIIKILVDSDGKVLKSKVDYSDNSLLDKEAIKAIQKYGPLEPAVQNNQKVACWISIPLKFRLK